MQLLSRRIIHDSETKRERIMKKGFAALLCAVAAVSAAPTSAKKTTANYTSLTVFGDSLVDAGNFFIDTNGARGVNHVQSTAA